MSEERKPLLSRESEKKRWNHFSFFTRSFLFNFQEPGRDGDICRDILQVIKYLFFPTKLLNIQSMNVYLCITFIVYSSCWGVFTNKPTLNSLHKKSKKSVQAGFEDSCLLCSRKQVGHSSVLRRPQCIRQSRGR